MAVVTARYTPDTLLAWLDAQGLTHRLFHHEAVFRVEDADRVSGTIDGFHTKNLFLKDKKGRMALVTLGHDTRVDLKKLGDLVGLGRVSFGSPALLEERLGVLPGSVTPLAILNNNEGDVALFLDKGMMDAAWVNVHPLINTMTLSVSPQGLMTILEKHAKTAQIIDVSSAAPESAV